MKKILLLAIILLSIACEKEEKGYSISAKTQGFDDGIIVYVNSINQSNRPVVIDSTTIKDEKFKMSLPIVENNDFNYLTFKDPSGKNNIPGNILFLAENNPIKITVYKDSLRSSLVKGGPENILFSKYIKTMMVYAKEKQELSRDYQIASKSQEKNKLDEIMNKQREITEKEKGFRTEIAEKNPNSLISIIALTDLLNLKAVPATKVKEIYSSLEDTLKTTRLGKNLERLIGTSVSKIDIGSHIDDFSAPTPEGNILSLKESMGKITIIDFWASWCKPCRAENPNVVRVYNKYHDRGLNIIGVSLDKTKAKWVTAIENDNLDWNHISNLQSWQEPIARTFGVRSIPATFIIDEKGNVIAKNLRGPALESRIAELLGEETL